MIRSNARATTRNGVLLMMFFMFMLLLSLMIKDLINIFVFAVAPWHHNC